VRLSFEYKLLYNIPQFYYIHYCQFLVQLKFVYILVVVLVDMVVVGHMEVGLVDHMGVDQVGRMEVGLVDHMEVDLVDHMEVDLVGHMEVDRIRVDHKVVVGLVEQLNMLASFLFIINISINKFILII
jgi:hypothetical protein